MKIFRPMDVLSGFHAEAPCAERPELHHVAEVWRRDDWLVQRHYHPDYWEFKLQVAGSSTWVLDDRKVRLKAGDVLILPPFSHHELIQDDPGDQHVIFVGVMLELVFDRVPGLRDMCAKAGDRALVSQGESVRLAMQQLVREVRAERPLRAEALKATVDILLIELARCIVAARENELLPRHPAVAEACQLLDAHSEKPWRLDDLGKCVGTSPNHLATLFRTEFGVTPHQYLLRARVARARALLRTADLSITDIAFETGFASSQHFARVFKKIDGRTPRDYRKSVNERGGEPAA